MADDIERVEVSTQRNAKKIPPTFDGLSPVQTGLLFGGAAASVGGPVGILVGLGTGIAQHIKQKGYLARQAAYLENLDGEYSSASEHINNEVEIADPDEKRMLAIGQRMLRDGYDRMRSGDQSGQELWDKGNAIVQGVVQGDISQRKQQESENASMQRSLVQTGATALRSEYQQNVSAYETSTEAANKLLQLTAQKDFDPNKPFYKAALTGLLADSVNSFYKDSPSVLGELTSGVGGALGSVPHPAAIGAGALVALLGNVMNAKEFEVSREDYNRIAMNSLSVAKRMTETRMTRLQQQGQVLEMFGKRNGVFSADYALGDYVTGGTDSLPILPTPTIATTVKDTLAPSTPTRQTQWNPNRRNAVGQRRPTN